MTRDMSGARPETGDLESSLNRAKIVLQGCARIFLNEQGKEVCWG